MQGLNAEFGARTGARIVDKMVGKRRHWKEHKGRYWARISIPEALRPFFGGKTQLTEPLGADLRTADRLHAAAVARLQAQIDEARHALAGTETQASPKTILRPITARDYDLAAWWHYEAVLAGYEQKRAQLPSPAEIEAAYEQTMQRIEAGAEGQSLGQYGSFNIHTEYELIAGARYFYERLRKRQLSGLQQALANDDSKPVDDVVRRFVELERLAVVQGSNEWRDLAQRICRAEILALERTFERDAGNFSETATDTSVRPPPAPAAVSPRVSINELFTDYITAKQHEGRHLDGGAAWAHPFKALANFLGHDDAQKVKKGDLLAWRDALLKEGKSAKTVSDKYLAAIRAVFKWAPINDRLPMNVAADVVQSSSKKVRAREAGFKDDEAVSILQASRQYEPKVALNPANRESSHITAAKRWTLLVCAFTGARTTEIMQLRKEDLRFEEGRWIIRITPDAGSVKTGLYRDVPLHEQVVEEGFVDFVKNAAPGPLFHNAKPGGSALKAARITGGRVTEWLHELGLVPEGVQPIYGWRHRFKTVGFEIGLPERVLDALQGHAARTGSDNYGDITIRTRINAIDKFPRFHLAKP